MYGSSMKFFDQEGDPLEGLRKMMGRRL
jgi:hypothetical protein